MLQRFLKISIFFMLCMNIYAKQNEQLSISVDRTQYKKNDKVQIKVNNDAYGTLWYSIGIQRKINNEWLEIDSDIYARGKGIKIFTLQIEVV